MKARLLAALSLIVTLGFASNWAVAQSPGPPTPPPPPTGPQPHGPPGADAPAEWPTLARHAASTVGVLAPQGQAAASIALGEPGLSYRYVRTFGVTEEPYLADTWHLNSPNGLYLDDSDNLFVIEEKGARLLEFDSSGANVLAIGRPGGQYVDDGVFNWPVDVALDSGGNIWEVEYSLVAQFDSSGNFLQSLPAWDDEPWNTGSDDDRFDSARGIAFDSSGQMFVSDEWNHRVQVFTFSGGAPVYSETIGETGVAGADDSHFDQPGQIAFDSLGRLYVMDMYNYRVQRCEFGVSWTCSTFFGETGVWGSDLTHLEWGAYGIHIDTSDNIFLADALNHRVLKCDTAGACEIFAGINSEPGSDNGHLRRPADVEVDSNGNVYVSDQDNHRIQKFTSEGGYMDTLGITGVPYVAGVTRRNAPAGVAVAADGSLYITEDRGYRLVKLNSAGTYQWSVGQPGMYGNSNWQLGDWWSGPQGNPAFDSAGRIYVGDTGNNRVQVFNPNGTFHSTFGVYGTGDDEFDGPIGIAIHPTSGDIFVADRWNHRVQVYTSAWVYKATLGETDVAGDDDAHFDRPAGVAVDASGNVFVSDSENHRVQKCTVVGSGGVCTTFLGEAGVCDDTFEHLHPMAIVLDGAGRVYVADEWNNRVQIFDSTGAYLTTIGGDWGPHTGRLRAPAGVAVDDAGNVYVTDRENHRVQKFAPGVPGWLQTNLNGFGDRQSESVPALAEFDGMLYAGAGNWTGGAQLWRKSAGSDWESVITDGFGDPHNGAIVSLAEFDGMLYAGTTAWDIAGWTDYGGQIWRSSTGDSGDWSQVVSDGFGDITNGEVFRLMVFGDKLYAAAWSWTGAHGAELWRSDTGDAGDWEQVVANGFGEADNDGMPALEVYGGYLYAGVGGWDSGDIAQVWRSSTGDGGSWAKVSADGFGDAESIAVQALAAFGGHLYAGISNWTTGGQVWRCDTCDAAGNWAQVVGDGFGDENNEIFAMLVFDGQLYAFTHNMWDGLEAWRTSDGENWEQASLSGLGDSNNYEVLSGEGVAAFESALYVGTMNWAHGGEVWELLKNQVYVPLVLRAP